MRKHLIYLAMLVLLAGLLAGCTGSSDEKTPITDIRQLDGQTIGVMTGSTFDQYTDMYINDAKKEYYTSYADMALAVEQGKIAAFLMDEPMARVLCAENPGVTYLQDYLTEDGYAFAFPKTEKGALLRDQMDEFLSQIEADGTLAEIEAIWFGTDESVQVVEDWTALPATNGTLEFAAKSSSAPFAYVRDNTTVGYDVDIVFAAADSWFPGIAQALEDAELYDDILMVGVDASTIGLPYFQEGHVLAEVQVRLDLVAQTAAQIAVDIVNGVKTADDYEPVTNVAVDKVYEDGIEAALEVAF